MTIDVMDAFAEIGAEVIAETRGNAFAIDIITQKGREKFKLDYPNEDTIITEVMDVKPKLRHLVMDVTGWRLPISGRYLCGHDERHWFVAALPFEQRSATVRGAMESLKPAIVRREQKRKGLKHRRNRRKTAVYVRQGEWFFLPRPKMHVGAQAIPNGRLARNGGKPHRVDWLYRNEDNETFVRGAVAHPDHATIYLQVWHRVVQNNEPAPAPVVRPFMRMDYVD